ncbi:PepSY-associated TM helix domain-containing protein [Sphingomonas sp. 37zxx]|uniref:PepSY-associated TM helix domain-containing protein n=1 Tax=Sphingomonas sp. 37zxx TaxID=1550073 RepID=UPI00053BFE9D|nr:PepSY-associated TM helix domain-containing protein [Sphingomonas sp. 37zxx]
MATLTRLRPSTGGTVKRRKTSRIWWRVHQWTGLKLSLFLSFIFLTGTLATVSHEIDWLLQPALRVSPASVEGPVAWDRIAEQASRHPNVKRILDIQKPVASAFAAQVLILRANGDYGWIYAHPTTGALQGEGHYVGAARVLRNMHRHLNLPTAIGVPIVGALAFLMLVSLVTSLVVYKKWWRGFFKPIRWRDARTAWGDIHRLSGLWSLWFVALIAVSGIWYFAESVGLAAPPPPRPVVAPASPAVETPMPLVGDKVAAGLAAVRATDPSLQIEMLIFPTDKLGAFAFQGQRGAMLVRPRANAAWTDMASGKLLLQTDATDMTLHQRISEAADPLHFGTFGGYWTKIPWFFCGLLLTGLAVSGVMIFTQRIARELGEAAPSFWRGSWTGMGRWRWLSVALIATGFAFLPFLFILSGE